MSPAPPVDRSVEKTPLSSSKGAEPGARTLHLPQEGWYSAGVRPVNDRLPSEGPDDLLCGPPDPCGPTRPFVEGYGLPVEGPAGPSYSSLSVRSGACLRDGIARDGDGCPDHAPDGEEPDDADERGEPQRRQTDHERQRRRQTEREPGKGPEAARQPRLGHSQAPGRKLKAPASELTAKTNVTTRNGAWAPNPATLR